MPLESLPWDSSFFGYSVGRIEADEFFSFDEADWSAYDVIYIMSDPANQELRQRIVATGARLYDEKVTFLKRPSIVKVSKSVRSYRPSVLNEYDEVVEIGVQSGVYSRFKMDNRFGPDAFRKLYQIWMRNSIERRIAREVFIYQDGVKPEGVITLGEKNGRADIGILAVDEASRGKQIGQQLIRAAEAFCLEHTYEHLQVVTQLANETACRFYEKCGFSIDTIINVHHWWNPRVN